MARDYQYYFSQLRRIEDHREAGSEKAIRKLYKDILKEVRHFIADEYAQFAQDGKLTFDILRSRGQDARFLQEVEQHLSGLSLDVSRQIRQSVEEMYQLAYDGLRDAVQKSKDAEELKDLLQMPDMNSAQMMWATVDNTIMDIALEKNHKNIIWDIKREVATALTVGDRFDTMAERLSKTLNGNYKKAILISRTEVGRVREAGHLASAKNLNETLKQGQSGLRMVKKWKSMKDGAVRDHHRSMHDKIVEMDEDFELPDGVKTQAPKQSGYARHDCNCRCTALYPMMDDEKFFKETGRHFTDMPANMSRNRTYTGEAWPKEGTPISKDELKQLDGYAKERGVRLMDFENFDGDPALVRDMLDGISDVTTRHPTLFPDKQRVVLQNSFKIDDDVYAETIGKTIRINNFAFRDKEALAADYKERTDSGWFVRGTDYRAIAYHEMCHVITNTGKARYSGLMKEMARQYNVLDASVLMEQNLSIYSASDPQEAVAEAFVAYKLLGNPPEIALTILRYCGIL